MFAPDEVRNWKKLVLEHPHLRESYCGQFLGSAVPKFGAEAEPLGEKIEIGTLRSPVHIFGNPYDISCLNGVGSWPVHAKTIVTSTVADGRVVGSNAVISSENELFLPKSSSSMSREAFLKYDPYGHQGFLVDEADNQVAILFRQRSDPKRYEGTALFLADIEAGNYGSFVFRQLPQMMHLAESSIDFDYYITSERTPFLMEAIDLLELPRKPVFTVREVSGDYFESITFFIYDDAEGFLSRAYRSQLRRLSDYVVNKYGSLNSNERIYVSRSLSTLRRPWYRVMKNETTVEGVARARGFEVVYPETWSLKDQIRIFANSKRIAGPSGSGMFNIAFATGPERVVDIETHHVTVRQHAKFYASCSADYSFLFSPYAQEQIENPHTASSLCSLDLLDAALDWLTE